MKDGLTECILVYPEHLIGIYLPDLQWRKDNQLRHCQRDITVLLINSLHPSKGSQPVFQL